MGEDRKPDDSARRSDGEPSDHLCSIVAFLRSRCWSRGYLEHDDLSAISYASNNMP